MADIEQAIKKLNVEGFIKTTDLPLDSIDSTSKVQLNRRGNELMNAGNVKDAERIFKTTGYSDGLTRVGNDYMKHNKEIDALKYYLLAHNKRQSSPLLEKIASLLSALLKE